MSVPSSTQAVLLLTAHLPKAPKGSARPLTPTEWGRFAEWLQKHSLRPEHLLTGEPRVMLGELADKSVTRERVLELLERGGALMLAVERWLRAGLWIMTRADGDYPLRLKRRLGSSSPAVLFGCGNRHLLNAGGLAVVGSRKAVEADLMYARKIGGSAAAAGVSIVSGGARGIDESAMLGSLEAEGSAVGVVADSLLRACTSVKYRSYLAGDGLVLVSSFHPEAAFNAGNAMQRNKYVYCLSEGALVVHSGRSGGTWTGAQENLKRGWVPLWVKPTDDPESGNPLLTEAGGVPTSRLVDEVDIAGLMERPVQPLGSAAAKGIEGAASLSQGLSAESYDESKASPQLDEPQDHSEPTRAEHGDGGSPVGLVDTSGFGGVSATTSAEISGNEGPGWANPSESSGQAGSVRLGIDRIPLNEDVLASLSLYEVFLAKVHRLCSGEPRSPSEIVDALGLKKAQVEVWLEKAHEEKELRKHVRPVRYESLHGPQGNLPLEDPICME